MKTSAINQIQVDIGEHPHGIPPGERRSFVAQSVLQLLFDRAEMADVLGRIAMTQDLPKHLTDEVWALLGKFHK